MATITQWKILTILTKQSQGTQLIREKLARDGINLTLRSVQRNLDSLSEFFPITSNHENPAGWRWAEGCKLFDLPVMDSNTALTLRLADQHLTQMMPKSCLDTLHPYMQRARKLLDEVADRGVGEWSKRVVSISRTQKLIPPDVKADVLDAVYQSVLEQRQLSLMYRPIGAEEAQERLVHPLGLAFADGVIYLVGTAWDYEDVRQFALHRVEQAELLESSAHRNDEFDLASYVAEGNFDFPQDGESIRIKLRVDNWLAKYLGECRLSDDQSIEKVGNDHLVKATVLNTLQLQWWLMGLGTRVEVLAPESLRLTMQQTIKNLHETYTKQITKNGGEENA